MPFRDNEHYPAKRRDVIEDLARKFAVALVEEVYLKEWNNLKFDIKEAAWDDIWTLGLKYA